MPWILTFWLWIWGHFHIFFGTMQGQQLSEKISDIYIKLQDKTTTSTMTLVSPWVPSHNLKESSAWIGDNLETICTVSFSSSCQQPYHVEITGSCLVNKNKYWAWLALWWMTAWEHHTLPNFHVVNSHIMLKSSGLVPSKRLNTRQD